MRSEIHVIARGVLIDNEHILLCKTVGLEHNFYYLPGGHVELNESASNTLVRELLEETGKNIIITRFLGCYEYRFKPKPPICHHHEYNIVFEMVCPELSAAVQPTQCEENVELHFIPLSKLNLIPFHPGTLLQTVLAWTKNTDNNAFKSEEDL